MSASTRSPPWTVPPSSAARRMYSSSCLSWSADTTGPMTVDSARASPTVSPVIRSLSLATNSSWTSAVTMRRLEAVQRWPVEKKAPLIAASAAASRSASPSTMSGFFPPISHCTFDPAAEALAMTPAPTPTDPVNVTASTSRLVEIASPTTRPGPMTRLSTPSGRPASRRMHTSACALAGTISAGLNTIVLP